MDKSSNIYKTYVDILRHELVPAMGCTEPIAVAFCAARAREVLGEMPDVIRIQASGNIIKNVKSVIVPHTGGLRGLEAAAAVGVLYGNSGACLELFLSTTFPKAGKVWTPAPRLANSLPTLFAVLRQYFGMVLQECLSSIHSLKAHVRLPRLSPKLLTRVHSHSLVVVTR